MTYTYDANGNLVKQSGSLTQVVAETDKDGKETASYTRGDELLSMERGGKIWYYIYDGHGRGIPRESYKRKLKMSGQYRKRK